VTTTASTETAETHSYPWTGLEIAKEEKQLRRVLRLEVARFAAIATVVLTVFSQPQVVIRVAEGAVTIARTLFLRLVTDHALEFFGGHLDILPSVSVGAWLSLSPALQPTEQTEAPRGKSNQLLTALSVVNRPKASMADSGFQILDFGF